MVLLLAEEVHIFGVANQIFPSVYIHKPNVPFLRIYNKKSGMLYNSLEYVPPLCIFYKSAVWRFLSEPDNPSNVHFAFLRKLNTTKT